MHQGRKRMTGVALVVVAALAGCAQTTVQTMGESTVTGLPRPEVVLV